MKRWSTQRQDRQLHVANTVMDFFSIVTQPRYYVSTVCRCCTAKSSPLIPFVEKATETAPEY